MDHPLSGRCFPYRKKNPKILVIGHARHGKDTVAQMICDHFDLTFKSSSEAAAEIFIFERLKEKYDYKTFLECFEDRVNHRKEWHDLITDYNAKNPSRLAEEILEKNDMYVGMRSNLEVEACLYKGLFDIVLGVFDPRKPLESEDSFSINIWEKSHFIIPNAGSLADLEDRIKILKPIFV